MATPWIVRPRGQEEEKLFPDLEEVGGEESIHVSPIKLHPTIPLRYIDPNDKRVDEVVGSVYISGADLYLYFSGGEPEKAEGDYEYFVREFMRRGSLSSDIPPYLRTALAQGLSGKRYHAVYVDPRDYSRTLTEVGSGRVFVIDPREFGETILVYDIPQPAAVKTHVNGKLF